MTYQEFHKKYNEVFDLVFKDRLLDALRIVSELSDQAASADLQNHYREIMETYRNMLKYSFELASDPERTKIHNRLKQSVLELADDIRELWIRMTNQFERAEQAEGIAHFEVVFLTDIPKTILKLSREITVSAPADSSVSDNRLGESQQILYQMFHWLWLKNRIDGETRSFFHQLMNAEEVDWSIKALMISAVTLSQIRHFDREKVFILFELAKHENPEIRQRAIAGLLISLLAFDKRILLYHDILDRLKAIPDDSSLQQRMFAVLLQYLRASDTDKITKKIQEEIVPEVMKIKSELEVKLKLDELLSKEKFDEKNPEWASFLKDAPNVYQKLEQFSKMQVEGADVFMGAFALLKHFPFFREITHWFLPFKASNEALLQSFRMNSESIDVPAFFDALEKSTILCNSDKYSFCLNVQHMPEQQRKAMLDLFHMEIKAMNEAMEDEFNLDAESRNKIVNTQYLQDLYRFFKLHPFRKEYINIFDLEINILNSEVLLTVFNDSRIISNLAEFYFARDDYAEALTLFNRLNEQNKSFELLEKMGYCYQKLADYQKAIELYQQAELFDKKKIWLQKKLGYCYRKTGDYLKAIQYYQHIVKSEPNDYNDMAYLGQLYIDTEDFESALKYYYKVEYQKPDNLKVYRPIGWCSFALGKYDVAIKYFLKVLEKLPNKSDFLNIGHCYWASGQLDKALVAYREAVRLSGNNMQWFRESFFNDSKYLSNTDISDLDVALLIDYVLLV
jgi:tetratricopeptide (TPR) repeat protein